MPVNNRRRLDDEEVVAPVWPEPVHPDPQNAIRPLHSGRWVGSEGDLQLVAENQVLKGEATARAEAGEDSTKQEDQKLKHPAGYQSAAATSYSGEMDGVLPPFRFFPDRPRQ
jgi:hypothetical protein